MTREEWIESADTRRQGFLRPGSIPLYGSGTVREHGSKVSPTAYPNQGLDLATAPYEPWFWLAKAETGAEVMRILGPAPADISAGRYKHPGRTPLGTSVAELTRTGGDMLASPCGYCGVNISKCRCGQGPGADDL